LHPERVLTEVDVNPRNSRLPALAAILLALVPGLSIGQEKKAEKRPAASPAAAAVPKLEFEKYTLPNGLQVILHVDRKLPMVHVNQWYHVGSKNERPGRTGFAHLFEHLMFQGSADAKDLLVLRREARRQSRGGRRQRHDQPGPDQLLRDRPRLQPRDATPGWSPTGSRR
jgi:predicted Zn-dependent peptidase